MDVALMDINQNKIRKDQIALNKINEQNCIIIK
jgi:hypothetical protein